jgi:hypothetical protein
VRVITSDDGRFLGPVLAVEFPPDRFGRFGKVPAALHELMFFEQILVPRLPVPTDPHRAEKRAEAWRRRSIIRGKRLVGSAWVFSNYARAAAVTFRQGGAIPAAAAFNWRRDSWLRVTGVADPDGQDYPERIARERDAAAAERADDRDRFFELAFRILVRPPDPTIGLPPPRSSGRVLIGGPQVNLGPELFPLGPQFASSETHRMTGAIELPVGFGSTLGLRLHDRPTASTPIGSDCDLDRVRVVAGASSAGRYKLVLERGSVHTLLGEFVIEGAGTTDVDETRIAKTNLRRGDIVTLAREDARPAPVEILLRTRSGRTI